MRRIWLLPIMMEPGLVRETKLSTNVKIKKNNIKRSKVKPFPGNKQSFHLNENFPPPRWFKEDGYKFLATLAVDCSIIMKQQDGWTKCGWPENGKKKSCVHTISAQCEQTNAAKILPHSFRVKGKRGSVERSAAIQQPSWILLTFIHPFVVASRQNPN